MKANTRRAHAAFAKSLQGYLPLMSMRGYIFRVKCACPLCELVRNAVTLYEATLADPALRATKGD